MIFITHMTFGTPTITILKSKYLLPSKTTKNVQLYGFEEGSKHIFLQLLNITTTQQIETYIPTPTFILDTSFLTKHNACLNYGWSGDCGSNGPNGSNSTILKTKSKSDKKIQKILLDQLQIVEQKYKEKYDVVQKKNR